MEADEDVRFWHKADIARLSPNLRFWGNSGHSLAALANTIYEYTL